MKIKLTDYDITRIIKEYYSIANNKFVSNVDFKISEDMTEFGRHIFYFSGAEIEVEIELGIERDEDESQREFEQKVAPGGYL